MKKKTKLVIISLVVLLAAASQLQASPRKVHTVALGAAKRVHYSKVSDPAGALPTEQELRIRGLIVDGLVKEWTTGEAHDVTDRSFVVRRVIRLNDALPTGSAEGKHAQPGNQWVWQRGPWLLVDRVTGHVLVLKLPDYDPGVSQVVSRLRGVLRADRQRQKSLCCRGSDHGAQAGAGQKDCRLRCGKTPRPGLRAGSVAARTVAGHLPSQRPAVGQL